MPEYILLFRKPTDNANASADTPVVKSKEEYTRGRWQVDAHAFHRPTATGFSRLPTRRAGRLGVLDSSSGGLENVYDHETHRALRLLAGKGNLRRDSCCFSRRA